jgi:hypothetical protein
LFHDFGGEKVSKRGFCAELMQFVAWEDFVALLFLSHVKYFWTHLQFPVGNLLYLTP